jgi:uracil-DNA glycosylase family 4
MNDLPIYAEWLQKVKACDRCELKQTRTQVVVSRHEKPAENIKVFLLGEAPGGAEDQNGIPFCGQAGQILTDFLLRTGLKDDEVYIGNVVKCRPTKPSTKGRYGNYKNRKPTRAEVKCCSDWLKTELELIQPKVLVPLGNVPLSFVLGKTEPIGQHHGRQFFSQNLGLTVFPLYHPAALIYDRQKTADYQNDIEKLRLFLQSI